MSHSRNFLLLVNSITQINAQNRQYKRLENVWNMFKINNKDIRATSLTSFWCNISYLFVAYLLWSLNK